MVHRFRYLVLISIGVLGLAAGCAPGAAGTPTASPATDPAITQWSDVSTPIQPTLLPSPTGQIDYEPTAAAVGSVPYSGYSCNLTADGCTCDSASVIRASFTFQPGDKLTYVFRGDTYGASWEMSRLGPNQWSYTIPIGADQDSGTQAASGNFFTVLTFTVDGFTLLQREDLGNGKQVTCPEVPYTRLSAVTPGP